MPTRRRLLQTAPLAAVAAAVPAPSVPPRALEGVDWTCCQNGEYTPPDGEVVWTSDGVRVRRGAWHPHDPLTFIPDGWVAGDWKDVHGDKIEVTHWLFEDDVHRVPAPPSVRLA